MSFLKHDKSYRLFCDSRFAELKCHKNLRNSKKICSKNFLKCVLKMWKFQNKQTMYNFLYRTDRSSNKFWYKSTIFFLFFNQPIKIFKCRPIDRGQCYTSNTFVLNTKANKPNNESNGDLLNFFFFLKGGALICFSYINS